MLSKTIPKGKEKKKTITKSSDREKISQIDLVQGKAKNLLKTTILVYALFIKVSQKESF